MTIWRARVRLLGDDSPSEFYYDSEEGAKRCVSRAGNGEVDECFTNLFHTFPYNGCSYSDLIYWNALDEFFERRNEDEDT